MFHTSPARKIKEKEDKAKVVVEGFNDNSKEKRMREITPRTLH
jgi:hypothetical protein